MKEIKNLHFKWSMCRGAAVLLLLLTFTTQMWAERWVSKCNIKYYTHNGITQTHDGWYNNDGFDIATANVTYNFGTLTQFYFKESWAQGSFDNNWGTAGCKMVYGFSADNQTDYKRDWGDQTGDNPKHYDFPIDQYDVIDHAPNKPGENTLFIYYHLNYNRGDGGDRKSKTLYINFTIPGFSGAPVSKSFGTSIPVNTESETTISFTHYGNALEVGDCSLSNATDFEIRSISESGVNVIFKPTTTGAKSSTLTITDDHGKTCTITLSGTAVAKGTTTRLYFNDYQYSGAGDWAAASALYRFTCAYTSGVYTHYNMTKCENTEHTYYADVEIKGVNVSIDRYNHSSPYETYNSATPTSPNLSSTNPYAKSTAINGAYATNHPVNDVGNRKIYYDNLESGFTNTICMLLGRDKQISNDASSTYSKAYKMSTITNTQLSYYSVTSGSDNWHDVTYYAFIGTDANDATISGWSSSNNWGSSTRSTKANGCGYTAAYTSLYGLIDGSTYLASAPSKTDGAMTITKSPTLNTTQTFNYALSTDGGTTYTAMTSGSPNTPGQLSMSSYEFTNAGCTAVVAKSAQELAANATTYTKAVSNVAYTGTTVLTESNTRDGYSFIGWYEGNTLLTASAGEKSYTYYPRGNKTYTARYKAHRYTIAFSNNNAQYSSAPAATGSTTSVSNVVYDQNATLTSNGFSRSGWTFTGWNSEPNGSGVSYTNGQSVSNLTDEDGATVTLYAQWTEDLHNVDVTTNVSSRGTISTTSVTDIGITTASGAITAAANVGYEFTGWTIPSGVTLATGTAASTSITINATADDLTITANFAPVELTFVGGTSGHEDEWGTVSNWSPACIPTIDHPVLIQSTNHCRIKNGTHAKALRVRIDKNDDSRKDIRLQINEKASLIVAEDIKAKHQGDEDFGATNDWDLWIMTEANSSIDYFRDYSGNGGLVCGKRDTETFISYMFASKIYRFGDYWINQYVGIPFASMSPYNWYGVYIFEYNPVNDKWKNPADGDLQAFTAYNIINKYSETWTSFFCEGYLNLPGINDDVNPETDLKYRQQKLQCGSRYGTAFDGSDALGTNGDYLFANSWTAPISVENLDATDVDGLLQEIHIFNAGYVPRTEGGKDSIPKELGDNPGQWTTITFAGAKYIQDSVIPATQAFCVTATQANASMTLDYKKHVYDPAVRAGHISTYPTRGPRRVKGDGDPTVLRIKVMRDSSSTSDHLYLFEREDYTLGYDNGWDGHKYFGLTNVPQIWSIQGEGKLALGAVPEFEGSEIGFKAGTDTSAYVLQFEYNDSEPLYLYDRETQIFTRINNEASYLFLTNDTDEHARFVITRSNAPMIETGVGDVKDDANRAEKFFENNMLFIRRGDKVYHVDGSVVK